MNYAFCDDMYVHDPPQASVSTELSGPNSRGQFKSASSGFST
jgi:hypothetical protein